MSIENVTQVVAFGQLLGTAQEHVESERWVNAEAVALHALEASIKTWQGVAADEVLVKVYTHGATDQKVEKVWARLGRGYAEIGRLEKAQRVFHRNFSEFRKASEGLALARVLACQGKTEEAVQIYYAASSRALEQNNFHHLALCISGIKEADPTLAHLEAAQSDHVLTRGLALPSRGEIALPHRADFFFGAGEWQRYFGDVGPIPPLPADIETQLGSDCPYWEGKKLWQTHQLVLVPKTVNGKPLTINSLEDLIEHPLGGGPIARYGHKGKYIQLHQATIARVWGKG